MYVCMCIYMYPIMWQDVGVASLSIYKININQS